MYGVTCVVHSIFVVCGMPLLVCMLMKKGKKNCRMQHMLLSRLVFTCGAAPLPAGGPAAAGEGRCGVRAVVKRVCIFPCIGTCAGRGGIVTGGEGSTIGTLTCTFFYCNPTQSAVVVSYAWSSVGGMWMCLTDTRGDILLQRIPCVRGTRQPASWSVVVPRAGVAGSSTRGRSAACRRLRRTRRTVRAVVVPRRGLPGAFQPSLSGPLCLQLLRGSQRPQPGSHLHPASVAGWRSAAGTRGGDPPGPGLLHPGVG